MDWEKFLFTVAIIFGVSVVGLLGFLIGYEQTISSVCKTYFDAEQISERFCAKNGHVIGPLVDW